MVADSNEDVVDRAKRLYSYLYDAETLADVETWDTYHNTFFWAYTYNLARMKEDRVFIDALADHVKRTVPVDDSVALAKPFTEAEMSIRPGRWFSRCHLIPATKAGV